MARIDTIQNVFGQAIRRNKVDPDKMAVAKQAILFHYSENTNHELCPNEKYSSCGFQRDKVNGKNKHWSIKDPLPKAVVNVIRKLFNQLGKREFLGGCVRCRPQNIHKSHHNVVCSLGPKSTYIGPLETKLAVELSTLFNVGFSKCFEEAYCGY